MGLKPGNNPGKWRSGDKKIKWGTGFRDPEAAVVQLSFLHSLQLSPPRPDPIPTLILTPASQELYVVHKQGIDASGRSQVIDSSIVPYLPRDTS